MKSSLGILMLAIVTAACNAEEWESVVADLTADEMLNVCMDGVYHRDTPGPEPELHGQCAQWSDRSCCFPNVSEAIHEDGVLYDIGWYHCGQNALSSECYKYLVQDSCFYECTPNVGPWLVEHKIPIRNERFVDVPLCASECNAWWDACKDDFTCSNDWTTGWEWSSGTAKCPVDKPCKTFREYFHNAKSLCENLWGGSFQVVPDDTPDKPCMKMFWEEDEDNPNYEVAAYYASKMAVDVSGSQRSRSNHNYVVSCLVLLTAINW